MTLKQKTRALYLCLVLLAATGGVLIITSALKDHMIFFVTPKDLKPGVFSRLGGIVVAGSIKHSAPAIRFNVTDYEHIVAVTYTGLVPDLFREGQGVVAEGELGKDGVFRAKKILAKHDENYMPKEVHSIQMKNKYNTQ